MLTLFLVVIISTNSTCLNFLDFTNLTVMLLLAESNIVVISAEGIPIQGPADVTESSDREAFASCQWGDPMACARAPVNCEICDVELVRKLHEATWLVSILCRPLQICPEVHACGRPVMLKRTPFPLSGMTFRSFFYLMLVLYPCLCVCFFLLFLREVCVFLPWPRFTRCA